MKIFLVGFMGAGKTFWGQQLSQKLSLPFFDLDHHIEEKEESTISAIFEKEGEEYFRLLEKDVLYLLTENHDSFVMATGGGTPCFFNNMGYMKKSGTVIWINCSVDVMYNRLVEEKEKRPLLKNLSNDDVRTFIKKKLADRKIYYEQATASVNDDNLKLDVLVSKIFHT
ncbi:MAG TPA: shikimate kinase [Chitinophagaceae bacterium]|nr:shikimate kinase [Chitinophagaceae bacterium]